MSTIFVFGSNTEGRHGAGAALVARREHGAIYGQPRGLQGSSYAIVTKDLAKGRRSIPIPTIAHEVTTFLDFARARPHLTFVVTPIGCGLAGYTPSEIGPLFANSPPNVKLPPSFTAALT